MTGGQRRAHLVLWLVLGPLTLVGLVFAVAWRPIEPVQDGPLPGIRPSDESKSNDTGTTVNEIIPGSGGTTP